MNYRILASAICFASATNASALEELALIDSDSSARKVEVQSVTGGGNGCANSGFELKRTSGRQLAKVVFDDLSADAASASSGLSRKTCNLAIQLKIPAGYQVALPVLVAEGSASTGNSARLQIRSEVWFQRGASESQINQKQIAANRNVLFELPLTDIGQTTSWSECSDRVVVRLNLSMVAQAPRSYGESQGTIENLKIFDPQVAGLRLKRCVDR
jgi:hypothetical protein